MFNQENWTYTAFSSGELQIKISQGGMPTEEGLKELFWVSLLDNEFQALWQEEFLELEQACEFANQRYLHWDFSDQRPSDEGGCSSCAAH